jgi:hypothetical protein
MLIISIPLLLQQVPGGDQPAEGGQAGAAPSERCEPARGEATARSRAAAADRPHYGQQGDSQTEDGTERGKTQSGSRLAGGPH